ncbi:MAG TPA: GNAT family N-acetyltransferase [Chloroflexia bacterium]|nr:GNAT family N-acetyltransferase [Chloroflexia bacterium]
MTTTPPAGLVPRNGLSATERQDVRALADLCNAQEGLELKLNLGPGPADGTSQFLYYAAGELIGFCSLDGDEEPEVCGMVHPAQRRRGIGRALLAAAIAETQRRGGPTLILICEAASATGQAFVATTGAPLSLAEYHMELDAPATSEPPAPADAAIQLQRASAADLDDLVRITVAAFGDAEASTRRRIAADLQGAQEEFYLARLGGTPIGSLKLVMGDGWAGIYGFGVLPEYQGQGRGRQILETAIRQLRAGGRPRITLEVESTNAPAHRLYAALGFRVTTTYGYYTLTI